MKSHSKKKCTECKIVLTKENAYQTVEKNLQSKCKECQRIYYRDYARKRAKLKKESSWF